MLCSAPTGRGLVVAAILLAASSFSLAQETTVRNDSFESGQSAVVVGGFIPGEHAGVRLTSPCNGSIVAVQIGWLHGEKFPAPDPSLERAIHIYDGSTFPTPGPELEILEAPLLTSGSLNEYRFVDEQNTIPLNVPVTAGQQFYVTLEFDNAPNILAGDASVFRDLDGCGSGKNVIFAPNLGGWVNPCTHPLIQLQGDFVIRAVVECDALTGACCLPSGNCEMLTQQQCTSAGGTYQGDLVQCGTVNCPEAMGACCFPQTGGCLNLRESQCAQAGGIFQGGGTTCATITCFPRGACCLPDGTCMDDLSPEECAALEGVFQGNNSQCSGITCPDPVGACCFNTGFCLLLSQTDCSVAGGSWKGQGTDCTDGNSNGTADACECDGADTNCDDAINAFDIEPFIDLLVNPGAIPCAACAGDVNGDGAVDAFDIEPFVMRLTGP
jgi:hypothetical protein